MESPFTVPIPANSHVFAVTMAVDAAKHPNPLEAAGVAQRLATAAPDLLAACEAALERIDGMNEAMGVVDELRAAIAEGN